MFNSIKEFITNKTNSNPYLFPVDFNALCEAIYNQLNPDTSIIFVFGKWSSATTFIKDLKRFGILDFFELSYDIDENDTYEFDFTDIEKTLHVRKIENEP
ncbi:hypothetical protein TRFO_06180 [Tritrichomonas foetus]|uniref:Uncharacterized protein n=1 Tax=Tritrichomonas foetus TaxID=1144522 RepID=A0A1J4K1B1_9EUKA|nr:hypothetical protein TRFO_06180 [Tritrichomonas foetus]|eukprot:OHT04746.1 hypothetical protein TRFO_06180 [Tritrichomonas foetus]